MNELQRQMYLSALGVDTYMPRWHLPFAPVSIACELPAVVVQDVLQQPSSNIQAATATAPIQFLKSSESISPGISPVNNLIGDILETKKISKPTSAADILAQLDVKPITVEPFSLSIWRPIDGVMLIDSRNTKLALPTELLLNNILRIFLSGPMPKPQEEILRWPMIENSFTKRTLDDARNELQTWLAVQHEIRPIHFLCLMGINAASYLLPDDASYPDLLFQDIQLIDSSINTLILPSLNEILQQPSLKQKLFFALRRQQFSPQ